MPLSILGLGFWQLAFAIAAGLIVPEAIIYFVRWFREL